MRRSYFTICLLMLGWLLVLTALGMVPSARPETSTTRELAPITRAEVTPFYETRIPMAYDVAGQPGIIVYGTLSTLAFENTTMQFRRDFTTSVGNTSAIFTFSTAGVTLDPDYTFTINVEMYGSSSAELATSNSQLILYILYQGATWIPIHALTTATDAIDLVNGWCEYAVPLPFSDYLVGTDLKVKVELMQQLVAPQSWTQRLFLRWLLLELQKDVGLNAIVPTRLTLLTPGFTASGDIERLNAEDGICVQFDRTLPTGGETEQLQFLLEYNLGYYGMDPLLGLRFAHNEWLSIEGIAGTISTMGRIALNSSAGLQFLCFTRAEPERPATPDIRHACTPMAGDWGMNGVIQFVYTLDYTIVGGAVTLHFKVDWARLQIVRSPIPIIIPTLLNSTIYAGQRAWLNLTCLDGKAPITEIRIQPWNDLVGAAAGAYLYNHLMEAGGQFGLTLNIKDAEGDQYSQPIGSLNVLYRPTSVALYLSEDPYLQELIIQLAIRDIFTNAPLPLHSFTKIILKNGTWFRQQDHQTTTSGAFTIHEPLTDYLDWNYTVVIEAARTTVQEAASVRASRVLSQCPPYITIHRVNFSTPLKANDPICVNYTVQCLNALDELWLCRNGSLFLPLSPILGTQNVTFRDVSGGWEYRLYANNSRRFQAYSSPFKVQIAPLKTTLALESTLDLESHAIGLEIRLYDELNRSCFGVPLQVTIFDQGVVFFNQRVTTGMSGVALIIHFDQYLDHAFTIQISSESTPLYKGTLLTASDLSYQGFPLYWLLEVALSVGIVAVALWVIRLRIRVRE